jgi:hypothetical protein
MTKSTRERWVSFGSTWKRRFLISKARPDLGSWIKAKSQPFRLGCLVCKAAGVQSPFAHFEIGTIDYDKRQTLVQSESFAKHSSTKAHKRAVCRLLGMPVEPVVNAPCTSHFANVLEAVRTRRASSSSGVEGVGKRHKVRRMGFCLAEAARHLDRQFLSTSCSIALMQDSRKGNLLVRFKACDAHLDTRRGILGQIKMVNLGARDIRDATLTILKKFCTPGDGAPFLRPSAPKPALDEKLIGHMVDKIEHFAADAASDEQLAASMLRDATYPSVHETWDILPNLKIISRDRAHASRRLTKRPWHADPFLQEVIHHLILGKHSITSLIQHSTVFSGWFQKNVQQVNYKVSDSARISNLSCIKVRFDSTSKPMSRMVLLYEAVLLTAQQIVGQRAGKPEAKHATTFLQDTTSEHFLQLAMLSDAADESMMHTRFCDSESVDNALLPQENHRYLSRLVFLFGSQEACWTTGFTKFIVDRLASPAIVFVGGAPRTIGGPGAVDMDMKNRCLMRMLNFCTLAKLTVKAEFPSFDTLCAFEAFALEGTDIKACKDDQYDRQLKLLARVFELDFSELREGFIKVRPVAIMKRKSAPELSSFSWWKLALDHVKLSRHLDRSVLCLLSALTRYGSWTASSCGVERSFSLYQWSVEGRKAWMGDDLKNDALKLVCDRDEAEDKLLIEGAQQVWDRLGYNKSRVVSTTRLDFGLPGGYDPKNRKMTRDVKSESGWIKRRRTAVTEMMSEIGAQRAANKNLKALKPGGDGWTGTHQREAEFLEAKRMAYLVDAVIDNAADANSLDAETLEVIVAEISRRQEVQRKGMVEQKRKDKALMPGHADSLEGKTVFFEPTVDVSEATIASCSRRGNWTRVVDRTQADVFVSASPSELGQRTSWATCMRGGLSCTLKHVVTNGREGAAVGWKNAARAKQTVYFTENFKVAHPVVFEMVEALARLPTSRWRWLADAAAVAATADVYKPAGRMAELLVFVTKEEFRHRPAVWPSARSVVFFSRAPGAHARYQIPPPPSTRDSPRPRARARYQYIFLYIYVYV